MPVKKDEQGRRYVEAEVEVPGTPEDVWRAIATGKGVSSWFVPTTIKEGEDGTVVSRFGPDMDAISKITSWNPPHGFTAEAGEVGQGQDTVATEWIVEARAGGRCVVRVVHRWFMDSDDWDGEFEGQVYGWATSFFRLLRLYLTHFAGERCSAFDVAAFSRMPAAETWRKVRSGFLIDAAERRIVSSPGAPELSGTVENVEVTDPDLLRIRETSPLVRAAFEGLGGEAPELLLRLDKPAPGLAHVFIMPMGEQTMVSARFHLFGDRGAAVAPETERAWTDWLADHFDAGADDEQV